VVCLVFLFLFFLMDLFPDNLDLKKTVHGCCTSLLVSQYVLLDKS